MSPTELHLLLALSHGPLHGYALVRQIEDESGGRLRLLPGNLYSVLRRLESDGLVERSRTLPAPDEDQRRRYYQLTSLGRQALEEEATRMEDLAAVARRRLGPSLGKARG